MFELRLTQEFEDWLAELRDQSARTVIGKLQSGLFGDAKPVGEGISELRFKIGPGYRVYFQQRGTTLILLLCGGDKTRRPMTSNGRKCWLPVCRSSQDRNRIE